MADANPDSAAIEEALLELEKARVEYNFRRDILAESLMADRTLPEPRADHDSRVRPIAELLWESAGRPTGTADLDWRRAEEIVREAAWATQG